MGRGKARKQELNHQRKIYASLKKDPEFVKKVMALEDLKKYKIKTDEGTYYLKGAQMSGKEWKNILMQEF